MRLWPSSSKVKPIRWYADSAFGLAYETTPSTSSRMKPSPARGLEREIATSPTLGKVPSDSMRTRFAAQSMYAVSSGLDLWVSPTAV
jgi:hypothetical protein